MIVAGLFWGGLAGGHRDCQWPDLDRSDATPGLRERAGERIGFFTLVAEVIGVDAKR